MEWQPLLIVVLFVVSQAALFTGCIGLARRKPLVVTGPGVAVALVGCTVAVLGACGWMVLEVGRAGANLAGFFLAAMACLLLIRAVHAAESACLVIGTTRRWVGCALRASFFRMSLPFREEGLDAGAGVSSGRSAVGILRWLARYQPVHLVRTRDHHTGPLGHDLAREMDDYFATNAVYTDKTAFRAMTAAGIVLLVATVYVWLRWLTG
jgi:hypothetical protein